MLAKADLFARLAEGHAARITVLTPNRRLAQALSADFDAFQTARGLSVWEAADILPFDAWVQRLWEDALYTELGATLPLLLTPAQEQAIWEEILRDAQLLSRAQTAAQCRDAWRLMHAWRIAPGRGGEDAAAFQQWAQQYEKRTQGDIDAARLPDLDFPVKKPNLVVAYAFDIVPPQTREFFARFALAECKPQALPGRVVKTAFPSAKGEIEQAAAWARARLEEGRKRIGVVVPELAQRRKEVLRVFSRVMQPGFNLPGAAPAPQPFNVSLGVPLADYALVDAALRLIQLSFQEIAFAQASRLLRSPFLGGAEAEGARRARLDARLRATLGAGVSLPKLIASIEHAPQLRLLLESVYKTAKETASRQTASSWARHFSALLEAAGFPGERVLDSNEFQTRAKWHETLAELAKLERVARELSIQEAFFLLKNLCADTLFQPESPDAPIQVLGILESAGLRFDCLWVSGLTDEAWPLDARPNPFLALALQKQAGVPHASAETALALDRRITEDWQAAAHEVVFSYPQKHADRDLAPSPLIAGLPEAALEIPAFPRYRDLLFAGRNRVSTEDAKGPAVPAGKVRGGTRVLADQAACPFRAFARWRLAAEGLEAPASGPDAAQRGKLLHALMKHLWTELKGSRNLEQDPAPVIARAAAAAVKESALEGRLAELERLRLAKLAREWLELEKTRSGFEVVAVEEQRSLLVSNLEFSSRIDRMDRLAAGGYALIDYKTGSRVTPKDWDAPRPDDPQLPLYALAAPEALAAVAFARVRPGAMKFFGFSREDRQLPGVKLHRDWPGLLAGWQKEADALGVAFASGEAPVDPKRDLKTCLRCDLQTLCRVYEKFNVLEEIEDEEGAE